VGLTANPGRFSQQQSLDTANRDKKRVRHLCAGFHRRLQWRLAHELKVVSTRRYGHGAKLIDDLGRQIGGWLRSRREAPAA